jgi:hypothetical protein
MEKAKGIEVSARHCKMSQQKEKKKRTKAKRKKQKKACPEKHINRTGETSSV